MIEEELKQMDKEELLGVIKAQKYEIENKDKVINGMIENEEKYLLEINKLKSIIKEVREYIENNTYFEGNAVKTMIYQDYSKGIIEILDKTNQEYNS